MEPTTSGRFGLMFPTRALMSRHQAPSTTQAKVENRPRFFRKDYTTRIGASALEGALVASLEWYWASTYLYRRISSASNQAYFTRYFLQSQYFGTRIIEPCLHILSVQTE